MENRPELDRGKNGQKMEKKWRTYGKFLEYPFLGHFLAIIAPVKLGAVFHLVFHFFPHFRLSGRFPFRTGPTESQPQRLSIFSGKCFFVFRPLFLCPTLLSLSLSLSFFLSFSLSLSLYLSPSSYFCFCLFFSLSFSLYISLSISLSCFTYKAQLGEPFLQVLIYFSRPPNRHLQSTNQGCHSTKHVSGIKFTYELLFYFILKFSRN